MRLGRPPHDDILTPREWEVLALISEGLTNEEIGERLGVSLSAVKYHVGEILSKLQVTSRQEAVQVTRRRSSLPGLAPLAWLKQVLLAKAHMGAITVGAVAAVSLTAGLVLAAPWAGEPPRPNVLAPSSESVGVDIAPFDSQAFEEERQASPYPYTILVAETLPGNYSAEDLAILESLPRVRSLVHLEQALGPETRVIVVDSSAAREFEHGEFLFDRLEEGLAVVTLNACLEQVSFRGFEYPAPTPAGPVTEISPQATVTVYDPSQRVRSDDSFCDDPINEVDVARFHYRRLPTEAELDQMREKGFLNQNNGMVHTNSATGALQVVLSRLDVARDGNALEPNCGVGIQPPQPVDPDCINAPATP